MISRDWMTILGDKIMDAQKNFTKYEEIEFHNNLYRSQGMLRDVQEKFYDRQTEDILVKHALSQFGNLRGKDVLFYGSGIDMSGILPFAYSNAKVTAIDISEEAIRTVNNLIRMQKVDDSVSALQMDCESMTFPSERFDVVFGRSIIHHINTDKAACEIYRVLKSKGKAIFIEPLGMNPLLNLYRYFTPKARTKGEHPLRLHDMLILKKRFNIIYQKSFFLISLMPIALKAVLKNNSFLNMLFNYLVKLDNFLFKAFPFLEKYAWCTIITLVK